MVLNSREFPFFFLIARISIIVGVRLKGSIDNLEHMPSIFHFLYVFKRKKEAQFHSGKIKKKSHFVFLSTVKEESSFLAA